MRHQNWSYNEASENWVFFPYCAFCKPKALTMCPRGVCTKAQLVFKRKQ